MENELSHHGIKGMKWGVRRYQNYDGTYTKKGLARYKKAESDYDSKVEARSKAREAYKSGTATKEQYKSAKKSLKGAKRNLKDAYSKLQVDNRADEGKKLYQQGKTITANTISTRWKQTGVALGAAVVNTAIKTALGDKKVTRIATETIAYGAAAANLIIGGKTINENRNLRAYYGRKS